MLSAKVKGGDCKAVVVIVIEHRTSKVYRRQCILKELSNNGHIRPANGSSEYVYIKCQYALTL